MTFQEELEQIRTASGDGILHPKAVVDFARNPDTALHSHFTWDDSEAAENYRLWQARKVIKIAITILPHNDTVIQTYVSLKQDRYLPDESGEFTGGYRHLCEVLKIPSLRKTLLEEAMEAHDAWEEKYQTIKELAEIFEAAKTVKQRQALMPAAA